MKSKRQIKKAAIFPRILTFYFFFFFHERFHVHKLSFCQFFIEHKKYPLTRPVSKWVKVVFNQCNTKQGEDTKSCRSRHVSQRELNIPLEMSLDFFFDGALYLIHWLQCILCVEVVLECCMNHLLPSVGLVLVVFRVIGTKPWTAAWKWSRTLRRWALL